MKNYKRTILIDLDGVLNNYDGKYDENSIPTIKDGAKELVKYLAKDFIVKIFTTRNLLLTSKWVINIKYYFSGASSHSSIGKISPDSSLYCFASSLFKTLSIRRFIFGTSEIFKILFSLSKYSL